MARRILSLRPALLCLLLGALLLRMIVPAGFMIAADAGGRPALVFCEGTLEAASPAMHAMHGRHAPADPAHRHQAPCPYAALAAPALPPQPPLLLPPPAPLVALPASPATPAPGTAAAASLPPSTGPPLLA